MAKTSKVVYGNTTLIDLTADTVDAAHLMNGYTAHGADGELVVGTYVPPTFNTQSKTVTPSESSQTIKPDSGYDGLSQVSVDAISSTYVGSGVTRQGTKTVTPTKSSQTAVASGVYTTGTISVGAIPSNYIDTNDANATNIDIVSGKTAYVNGSKITGQLVIQKYYTGSTDPSSSLGNNGDIYLKV